MSLRWPRHGQSSVLILGLLCFPFFSSASFADVLSISLSPTSVYGTDTSSGTVTIDAAFNRPIRVVDLSSSNSSIASVPDSVTNLHGGLTLHFTVTTFPVAVATEVSITATEGGVSKLAIITVNPPKLVGLTFDPNPVRGGDSAVATITTNRPAPSNWLCSIEGPFPPIYFQTGSIVTFTSGASSTTKTVNTQIILNPVNALITVRPPTGQSPTVSSILGVVPTRAQSLTLDPQSITGGVAGLGCVTLNGTALPGGATVTLLSSNPDAASVPPTLQIAAGDNDGCFIVQSHAVDGCVTTTISAPFGGQTVQEDLDVGMAEQLTGVGQTGRWGPRNSTTVDGKVLWTNGDDVYFFDGVGPQLVQARGNLEAVEPTVFGLGSGEAAGEVIGAWRRGTDFAWVWKSSGQPILVSAVNPIDPQQAMNPEAIAIADGNVFMVLQAFFNANSVKHVFRVDPATGVATNLTGDAALPGASRVTTSEGQASWVYVDSAIPKLHFFDGSTIHVVDSGPINGFSVRMARGRVVYEKTFDGASHVFLYDDRSQVPASIFRISPDTDATHGNFAPITDGYQIAWLFGNADKTNLDVFVTGGLQLNDANHRPVSQPGVEIPLQLQRGQFLWSNAQADLNFASQGSVETLCVTPAASFSTPWLADGFVTGFGPVKNSADPSNKVFLLPEDVPNDAELPMPPIVIVPTPVANGAILQWDGILGTTSYSVYLAEDAGVTKQNFSSLPGGQKIESIAIPVRRICGLVAGTPYHFVVTSTDESGEGAVSHEVSATPLADSTAAISDVLQLLTCLFGPGSQFPPDQCSNFDFASSDLNCDGSVSLRDFAAISNSFTE